MASDRQCYKTPCYCNLYQSQSQQSTNSIFLIALLRCYRNIHRIVRVYTGWSWTSDSHTASKITLDKTLRYTGPESPCIVCINCIVYDFKRLLYPTHTVISNRNRIAFVCWFYIVIDAIQMKSRRFCIGVEFGNGRMFGLELVAWKIRIIWYIGNFVSELIQQTVYTQWKLYSVNSTQNLIHLVLIVQMDLLLR